MEEDKLCEPYLMSNWTSLLEAKHQCNEYEACDMFFDSCGQGKDFRYCSLKGLIGYEGQGIYIKGSGCGSILYTGKFKISDIFK